MAKRRTQKYKPQQGKMWTADLKKGAINAVQKTRWG